MSTELFTKQEILEAFKLTYPEAPDHWFKDFVNKIKPAPKKSADGGFQFRTYRQQETDEEYQLRMLEWLVSKQGGGNE